MKKSQKHPTQYLIVDEFERINRDRARPHSPLSIFIQPKKEEVQCRRCQQYMPATSLPAHQSSCGQHLQWQDRQMEDHYDLRGHRMQDGYKRSMIHSRQEPIRNENFDYYPRAQSKTNQQQPTNKTKRPMSAIGKKKAEIKPEQLIQRMKKTFSTSKLKEEKPKLSHTGNRQRGEFELKNNLTLRRQAEPIRLKKKNANLAQKSIKMGQQSRTDNRINAEQYCQQINRNREQEKQEAERQKVVNELKKKNIFFAERNKRLQQQRKQREDARLGIPKRTRLEIQHDKIMDIIRSKERDQASRTQARTQREPTRQQQQPTRVSRQQPRQEQRRPQRVQRQERQERHQRQQRPERQQERPERQQRRQQRRGNNRGRGGGIRGRASRVDSPTNIFNFVSQAMNQQISLMNSQFSIMSNVFENFSNFIHINIDTRPHYFPGSSQHFESSDQYSDSSESDDSDYDYQASEPEGMDEDQIEMIPSQKYHPSKHGHHQCTVCLAELQEGDVVKKLYCQHIFHADCISEWLKRKSACPVCRDHIGPH